ncbi:Trypsin epsilon [Trichoplax sp. H2]|nr:Trypsin epsilon [Trichoplax sp. H2]|eukprot:RDD36262.1 Trypsin epsilon [Trichoplax sp. H2]
MKILVVIALFACATAFRLPPAYKQVPQEPRFENDEDDKIVGGYEAKKHEFPFIISLQRYGSHFCGGSIVSSTRVLTAAHCTRAVSYWQITANAGRHNVRTSESTGQSKSVSSMSEHWGYNSNTYRYDVAVIRLSSAFTFNSYVKTVTLSSSNPSSGTRVTVAGWGTLSSGGSSPSKLQKVDVYVDSYSSCNSDYSGAIDDYTMLCASSNGKDSCQGDSGGPLVRAGTSTQVGVVSWGYGCADSRYPGVYAKVAATRSWINSQ